MRVAAADDDATRVRDYAYVARTRDRDPRDRDTGMRTPRRHNA